MSPASTRLPDDAVLRDVVAAAPEGAWREIFASHLKALSELTAEIRNTRDENSRLLRAGLRLTQETLNLMAEPSSTYTADGTVESAIPAARLIDAAL
ncbi:flagellar export chaperone FlgN [Leifsonia xyli]|uniref:flagellar export chaperone FlgN n=1 Tax=Leifsonia xyli TaxID=1575 RepID=UPI00069336B8|nr:flagellar export chaperone FlgN [Leifsonia xyli]